MEEEVELKVKVPTITQSAIPTDPEIKVLLRVIVGFSVYVPAVRQMLTGIVSVIPTVAARAAVILANGQMTEPVPEMSEPLTATQ